MLQSKTLHICQKGDLVYVTFPAFEKLGLRHAFSTRFGGVSEGMYGTANFSFTNGDDPQNVLENYRRLCGAIGVDYQKCALSKQTHKLNVRVITEEDIGKGIVKERDYDDIDAIVTNLPGVPLVTQYADCVPVLLYDPVRQAIGAAHASWRCTYGRIVPKTVQVMQDTYGTDPKDLVVGIAPSIGQCCFETGPEVYAAFCEHKELDMPKLARKVGEKYYLDLWEINRIQLVNLGVKPENITVGDLCTKCHPDVFHSHRATGGKRGNNAAIIALND